jgi:hypothetical protein
MRKAGPIIIITLFSALLFNQCDRTDELYHGFKNPPAEARPFMRWWWSGNRITEKEIRRQLDVLSNAGMGGVEINPIAMPPEADTTGTIALTWLSTGWNKLLATASKEAGKRE